MNFKKSIFLLILFFTTSCVESIVIGTLATGAVLTRQKSLDDTAQDIVINTLIETALLENGLKKPGNYVDIVVNEGRVLMVGFVADKSNIDLASEIAWKVKGVKEVMNELQVNEDSIKISDIVKSGKDYTITGQIEFKLFLKRGITSGNYQITTLNGTVYLIGVAKDREEMESVISVASRVSGVKKVVNFVITADDERRKTKKQ